LFERTATMPCRLIKLDGQPYIERYFVGASGGHYQYLHRFVRADSERHLHDHPWRIATSAVLCGRYTEERITLRDAMVGQQPELVLVNGANHLRRQPHNQLIDLHRITSVAPETWTLFSHAEWEFPWGFYTLGPVQQGQASVTYQQYEPNPGLPLEKHWWRDAPQGAAAGR